MQAELIWLHRDIKSLPQEIAEPGAVARTLALDSVHPVKGAVEVLYDLDVEAQHTAMACGA